MDPMGIEAPEVNLRGPTWYGVIPVDVSDEYITPPKTMKNNGLVPPKNQVIFLEHPLNM